MTGIEVLGIDLGKSNCSVVGLDETGRVVLRRRVSRDGVAALLAKLSPSACCTDPQSGRSSPNPV